MKLFGLGIALSACALLLPALALALTFTTPNTTDGIVESSAPIAGGTTWETDEVMANDGGTSFYLTWDAVTKFCAIAGTYANQSDGQYDWFIAFDTDLTAGSGATTDGYNQVTFSGRFLPEYIYYFAGGMGWYESTNWTGTAWNWRGWSNLCTFGGWSGNLASEICIPDSMIGYADSLAVCSWITDEANSQIFASYPTPNPIGTKPQPMTYFWVARNLGSGVAPNMSPVKPTPPSAIVDNERVNAFTCVVRADITPGNCGAATAMIFYYTTDGSTPGPTSSSVTGVYETCRPGADTTDTFKGTIPAADGANVKWIAKGTARNGLIDWSDVVQSFVQGGTAWVGNAGSTPTDCTVWAEIFVGDGGQTTWMKFKYTTDASDPRTSGTAQIVNGIFDALLGNNDKYYAVLSGPTAGQTVRWYAYGKDSHNNTAQTDTFYTFIQGDTARIYNLQCVPDSNYVTSEVAPKGLGAGMNFIWTTDGTDPTTSPSAHTARGAFLSETDSSGVFGAYLTAQVGNTIKWYVHAWGSNNAYNDSDVQTCVAGATTGPTLCNLVCVPESLLVRASISPRGFGAEIDFICTHDGSDPKTSPTACTLRGGFLRDEDTPGGDCTGPVGTFFAELYGSVGETIKWYAHGWYQPDNKYNGLFGDSPVQTCVAGMTRAGVEPKTPAPVAVAVANVPNPFGASTRIKFNLPKQSKVTILVYDIAGRVVAEVFNGTLGEGEHTIAWNGKTRSGEDVPSGIYFYRFQTQGYEVTKKAVVVR
ncbi:MAG: FlgD immunoglobulin-like domain containing protein [Candidatus Eisenbacteria bacterium]